MEKYDLYVKVITGMNSKLNKKALREVLAKNEGSNALNDILYQYYKRANYMDKGTDYLVTMVYRDNFGSDEEFRAYLKDNYNVKWYKKAYDYKELGKIKQKNTGLVLVYHNGFMAWGSYAFDMYAYVMTNQITVE
jgi:hypothetical protein